MNIVGQVGPQMSELVVVSNVEEVVACVEILPRVNA